MYLHLHPLLPTHHITCRASQQCDMKTLNQPVRSALQWIIMITTNSQHCGHGVESPASNARLLQTTLSAATAAAATVQLRAKCVSSAALKDDCITSTSSTSALIAASITSSSSSTLSTSILPFFVNCTQQCSAVQPHKAFAQSMRTGACKRLQEC